MNPLTLLKYLRNPFVLALAMGVLVVISFFIDAKMNNRDRNQADYLKLFTSVVATSLTTHFYLKSKPSSSSQYGGSHRQEYAQAEQPSVNLYDDDDVYADTPNF